MELNIDPTTQNLYMLVTLDPHDGREDEAETLIKPFGCQGFRFFNTVVFSSADSLEKIKAHIQKVKSSKYQFFLLDITQNLKDNNFGGFLHPKYYPIADQAAKIINAYRPVYPELSDVEKVDVIYNKINKSGIDSLTTQEKLFLDDWSKRA